MKVKDIQEVNIKNKVVFLRLDLDVPIENGIIKDDLRLHSSLKTLSFLLENAKEIIICGHLGRPVGIDKALSLLPIRKWLSKNLEIPEQAVKACPKGDFLSWEIGEKIVLLENIRFFEEEEKNNSQFSKKLASMAEVYVNDAFASCHRKHASIAGITNYIPSFAGLHLLEEIKELGGVLDNPERPLSVIIGGAKIDTKLPLISKMHKFANFVLVGGELAKHTKELIKIDHQKSGPVRSVIEVADLKESGKDIGEYSINNFIKIIYGSKTVVWNGPMGEFEKGFDTGTKEIAHALVKAKVKSIVGGGDTIAFIKKEKLLDKYSFASTGGGAMLEFLAGEKLPGLETLKIS